MERHMFRLEQSVIDQVEAVRGNTKGIWCFVYLSRPTPGKPPTTYRAKQSRAGAEHRRSPTQCVHLFEPCNAMPTSTRGRTLSSTALIGWSMSACYYDYVANNVNI